MKSFELKPVCVVTNGKVVHASRSCVFCTDSHNILPFGYGQISYGKDKSQNLKVTLCCGAEITKLGFDLA